MNKMMKSWLLKTAKMLHNDTTDENLYRIASDVENTPFKGLSTKQLQTLWTAENWMMQSQYKAKWGSAFNIFGAIVTLSITK